MRRYGLLLALALSSVASADRFAVLVGVDKYSFITEPTRQLQGAETDTSLMKRMLDLYGFKSTVLLRSDATRKRIVEEMSLLSKAAKSGDEAVFYFSGRGTIQPNVEAPNNKTDFEPALAPFDASATALDPDIRMRRIEDWAKQLDIRGVHVTIILDCSFQSLTRAEFGRQYHPIPRSFQRPSTAAGEVRDKIYDGPGIFLSAAPSRGAAYEWLQNSAQGRWSGAFTDQLVNSVVAGLNRGENPSYVDAMREVQAYFKDKVRADYMPGLAPQPDMEALLNDQSGYGQPVFGGLDLAALPADSKVAIAAMERLRVEREKRLRVAVEVEDPVLYDKAAADMTAYLKSKIPNAEFAPTGAPPDVIVHLKKTDKGIDASVKGDDLDKERVQTFSGKDLGKTLDAGLGAFLDLRALVMRLYRITATEQPTWKNEFRMQSDKIAVSRGDDFILGLTSPEEAMLFVLNRDDADGVLQFAFPQPGAPFAQKLSGSLQMGGRIENDTSTGRLMLRAIVVPTKGGPRIPDVDMKDPVKFRASLIRQLRTVVEALEKNQLPWTAKTINIRVR